MEVSVLKSLIRLTDYDVNDIFDIFALTDVNHPCDYGSYSSTLNSAPFYLWILLNAICLVFPALNVFIVGIVLKKKNSCL